MNPFHNRPDEWRLLEPHVRPGYRMLELGNKKNGDATYKAYFESLGVEHVSVDINGQDGALKRDLRKPYVLLDLGTFDVVTNIGTTEHVVSDQTSCWMNVIDALALGAVLVSITPKPGDWWWHGHWYPTPEFYASLAELNGLEVLEAGEYGTRPNRNVYVVARRTASVGYAFPNDLLYHNQMRARHAP